MNPLRLVFVEPKGGGKIQDGVTVTPTKEEQTVEPDPGFDGLGAVTVEAIPDAYQDVTGVNARAEDIRVGRVGIDAHGNLLDGEMLPRKPEQEKSVIPTKQAQTVEPDSGYALSAVNVAKIPDAYQDVSFVDNEAADIRVGKTGVSATGERLDGQMLPRKPEQVKSVSPTTSPQSVTPDTGYALSRVDVGAIPSEYADVSDVTATAGTVLTGSDFVDASGTLVHGACDYDADTSDADATAEQIEAGATAYVGGVKVIGTMPIRSADVEISDLSPVPIPAGSYDGTSNAKIDDTEAAKIVPANIKKDVEIFGQVGTYEGADTLGQYFADTLTSVENANQTEIIAVFFQNKTALVSATFQNVTAIRSNAFDGCSSLETADVPQCSRIETCAFRGCSSLIYIPTQNLVFIGVQAFKNCSSLPQSMAFPNVTTINGSGSGGGMFNNSSVRRIEFGALTDTRSHSQYNSPFVGDPMEILVFDVLANVGTFVFSSMNSLSTLVIRSVSVCSLVNINAFYRTPFDSNGSGGTLYVPQDQIAEYQSATNWSVILAYTNNQILPIEGSPYEVTT